MKKLYKKTKGRMICGICAGMADYFNIDVTIIRLIWVVFGCMGGSGILAYLIAAIIIPADYNM